ncbi:hypothetical protein HDU67_005686, partial [Dinochytrium kinnereticum]
SVMCGDADATAAFYAFSDARPPVISITTSAVTVQPPPPTVPSATADVPAKETTPPALSSAPTSSSPNIVPPPRPADPGSVAPSPITIDAPGPSPFVTAAPSAPSGFLIGQTIISSQASAAGLVILDSAGSGERTATGAGNSVPTVTPPDSPSTIPPEPTQQRGFFADSSIAAIVGVLVFTIVAVVAVLVGRRYWKRGKEQEANRLERPHDGFSFKGLDQSATLNN